MKIKWSQFWNFFIQFFVVILGVLITFWISGINDNSKQKKKTHQALELVVQELEDYLSAFGDKKDEIDLERKMYLDILKYSYDSKSIPPADTLLLYRDQFFRFSLFKTTNLSLDIAEKTGAFTTINDLGMLENIYNSFLVINMFYDIHEKHHTFKKEQISKSMADKTLTLETFKTDETNDTPHELQKTWDILISNEHTYLVITKGIYDIQMIHGLLEQGEYYIQKTIAQINDYLN